MPPGNFGQAPSFVPQPPQHYAPRYESGREGGHEHPARIVITSDSLAASSRTGDPQRFEPHNAQYALRSEFNSPQILKTVSEQPQEPYALSERPGHYLYLSPDTTRLAHQPETCRPPANRPPIKHLAVLPNRPGDSEKSDLSLLQRPGPQTLYQIQTQATAPDHSTPEPPKPVRISSSKQSREQNQIQAYSQNNSYQEHAQLAEHSSQDSRSHLRPGHFVAQLRPGATTPQASRPHNGPQHPDSAPICIQFGAGDPSDRFLQGFAADRKPLESSTEEAGSSEARALAGKGPKSSVHETGAEPGSGAARQTRKPVGPPAETKLRTRINELIWENTKLRKEKEDAALRGHIREEVKLKEQEKELVRLRAAVDKKSAQLIESQQHVLFANRKMEEMEKELIRLREIEKFFNQLGSGATFGRKEEHPAQNQSGGLTPERLASLESKLDLLTQLQTQSLLRVNEIKDMSGSNYPPLLAALTEVRAQVDLERADLLRLAKEKENIEGVIEGLRERLKAERRDSKPGERARSSSNLEEKRGFAEDQKISELLATNPRPDAASHVGMNFHNAFNSLLEDAPGPSAPAQVAMQNGPHPFLHFGSANPMSEPQNTFEESLLSPSPPKKSELVFKPTKIDTSKNLLNSLHSNSPKQMATSILVQHNPSNEALLTSTVVQPQHRQPASQANALAGPFNIAPEPVSFSDSEDIGAKRVVSRFGTIVPNRDSQNHKDTGFNSKEYKELKEKYEQILEENRKLLESQQKAAEQKQADPEPEPKLAKRETRDRDSEDDSSRQRFTRLDYFGERPSIPSAKLNFISINDDKKKEHGAKKEPADFSLNERRKTQVDLKEVTSIYSFQPPQEMISALTNYVNSIEPRVAVRQVTPNPKPEAIKDSDVDFGFKLRDAIGKPSSQLDSPQTAQKDCAPDGVHLQVQNRTVMLPSVKSAQECVSAFYSTYPITEQPENEEAFRSSRADTGKFGDPPTPKLGTGFAQRQFSFKESPPQSMPPKEPGFESSGLTAQRPRLDSMAREITDMKKVIEEEREERAKIATIVREKDDEVRALRQQLEHMRSSSREQTDLALSRTNTPREDSRARPRLAEDREPGEEHEAQDEGNSYRTSGTLKDKKKSLAYSSGRASFQSQDNKLANSLLNRKSLPTSAPEDPSQGTQARQPRLREDAARPEEEGAEKSPKSRSSSRVRTVEEINTVYRTQVKTTVDESFRA